MIKSCHCKPVFILSGFSGTGKSTILEDFRLNGVKALKSFSKFLLNVRFGYGVPTHEFLIMSQFMQAYAVADSEGSEFGMYPWIIERSPLDGYIMMSLNKKFTEDEECDINNILNIYFNIITKESTRKLVILDIWNFDKNWIESNLLESNERSSIINSYEEYIKLQSYYKSQFFNVINKFNHESVTLKIDDINNFNAECRRNWIKEILKSYDLL